MQPHREEVHGLSGVVPASLPFAIPRHMSFVLHGIGVSGGIAIGRAQLVSHATLEVAHYSITPAQVPGEIERLTQALKAVQKELESLRGAMTAGPEANSALARAHTQAFGSSCDSTM